MTLEIYSVVLELVRRLGPGLPVLRARSAALADQFERALISVPLNVAEGAYSRGRNRQARANGRCFGARGARVLGNGARAGAWCADSCSVLSAESVRAAGFRVAMPGTRSFRLEFGRFWGVYRRLMTRPIMARSARPSSRRTIKSAR